MGTHISYQLERLPLFPINWSVSTAQSSTEHNVGATQLLSLLNTVLTGGSNGQTIDATALFAATQGGGQHASATNTAAAHTRNATLPAVANTAVGATLAAAVQGGPASTSAAGGGSLPSLPTEGELAEDKLKVALVECGLTDTTGCDRFIKSQGLTGILDLASLTHKDAKCLVETLVLVLWRMPRSRARE